jgi:(+)-trans-carveol dehydrogenase
MGLLDGKVALITGAARGQGRSHAVRMAEEGADIIAVDLCAQVPTVPYAMATDDDLAETTRLVEALDRRIVASVADVRDSAALRAAVDAGVAELGHLDIVVANAGIFSTAKVSDMTEDMWDDMIAINLSGVWRTVRAALPHLRANSGASIVLTSSTAGASGSANVAHYVAAKHGVVGLMKSLANELAPQMIRVNTVQPTTVDTPMVQNQVMYDLFRPDLAAGSAKQEDAADAFLTLNALPVPWVEPADISNAIIWLCSDYARYVTGIQLPVDAGSLNK